MAESIDVELFLSHLADDKRLAVELEGLAEVEKQRTGNRCQARRKRDGRHCQRYAKLGGTMCRTHRDQAPRVPAQAKASPSSASREHAIDALIQAAAGTPATAIRETLGTVLDEFLTSAFIVDLENLERRLRKLDGDA